MNIKYAVILAGGKGSRIKKYLKNTIKPLIKIGNKSIIEILLKKICKYNFKKVFIIAGHKGHLLKKKYNNKSINFTKIECLIEKTPMDTGGALSLLKFKINSDFILFNSDSIFDFDLSKFKFVYKKSLIKIALTKNNNYLSNKKLSNLILKKNLIKIRKKNSLMNGGVYLIRKEMINTIPKKKISLENQILPSLINKKKVEGSFYKNFFYDIGTPKNLINANTQIKKNMTRPAVFFDRDGVLNFDKGYTHKKSELIFLKNVEKTIKFLNNKNYYVFVITNQSGIARGIFTVNDFVNFSIEFKKKLSHKDAYIDNVKFCPHHPDGKIKKFSITCSCRKPNNKLFQELIDEYFIDIKKSFMIGDSVTDEMMARKSNIKFSYIKKNHDLFKLIKLMI